MAKQVLLLLLHVLLASALQSSTGECPAQNCDAAACQGPDCHCFPKQTDIPDNQRPQIVYLTYDDAFTAYAEDKFYKTLFDGTFRNPDDCPIRATHFLSAQYTDYSLVNKYRNMGHEFASHSITHRTNTTYWGTLDEAGFEAELNGMRKMAAQFANIPKEEIIGTRIPFLIAGGEPQFTMMQNNGFKYDCSMPTRLYGYIDADRGLYPYTLDYKSKQDCEVGTCPKCSYPGMWVQPMIDLEDNWHANPNLPDYGMPCSMLDACIGFTQNTPEEIKEFLMRNFNRVYTGSKAPWGLYMHAAWFYGEYEKTHYVGYKMFLEEIVKLDDVWIVPIRDGLEYMMNPMNQTDILAQGKDSVFGCNRYDSTVSPDWERPCGRSPTNCKFSGIENEDIHNEERYMKICSEHEGFPQGCPDNYPWLGDPCGGPCE